MNRSIVVLVGILFVVGTHANPLFSADPVEIQGSAWSTSGQGKTKVQGLGTAKFGSIGDIFFGPQTVDSVELASDEFLVILDDGETQLPVVGNYTANEKGKPTLFPAVGVLEEILAEIGDADVTILRLKANAKPKSRRGEETIKVKAVVKFLADGQKVTLSYKGQGARFEGGGFGGGGGEGEVVQQRYSLATVN